MMDAVEPRAGRALGNGPRDEAAVPSGPTDFDRPVVSILGLPFDALGMKQAVQHVRRAAFSGRRCFVSTPNLNFAVAARTDSSFRDTVLRSDLNLVDGMPLVWVARLLGLPVFERVAGSDLFEALQGQAGPPIKVYLFGGLPGAAAQACAGINRRGGGMQCVGHDPAGFGSIESMSSPELIERINRSGAHFVLVSLGAKKGHEWLERNAAQLTAPVLSHLGAVMNFAAGTVRRAPRRMRWLGLEWLWRIKEEPGLWRRYWHDGIGAVGLFITRVLPDVLATRSASVHAGVPGSLTMERGPDGATLVLDGSWQNPHCDPLRKALGACLGDGVARVVVDLSKVTDVGDTFVALCLLACGRFGHRGSCRLIGAGTAVRTTFRHKLAEQLLAGDSA